MYDWEYILVENSIITTALQVPAVCLLYFVLKSVCSFITHPYPKPIPPYLSQRSSDWPCFLHSHLDFPWSFAQNEDAHFIPTSHPWRRAVCRLMYEMKTHIVHPHTTTSRVSFHEWSVVVQCASSGGSWLDSLSISSLPFRSKKPFRSSRWCFTRTTRPGLLTCPTWRLWRMALMVRPVKGPLV